MIRRLLVLFGVTAFVLCMPLVGTVGAILSSVAGTAAVNGRPVPAGSAVVAGDLVATETASRARMVLSGSSLLAAANTSFRLEDVRGVTQIRLRSGWVTVSGDLPVALSTRTVIPASPRARFAVYDRSGEIYVKAISGRVTIASAHRRFAVPDGRIASFSDSAVSAAAAPSLQRVLPYALIGLGVTAIVVSIHSINQSNSVCQSLSPSCL